MFSAVTAAAVAAAATATPARIVFSGARRCLSLSPTLFDGKDEKSSGGAIRGAGGKFAERESAFEGEYFHKLEREQLAKLKQHYSEEIKHHEEEIARHQDAIKRHQSKAKEIEEVKDKK